MYIRGGNRRQTTPEHTLNNARLDSSVAYVYCIPMWMYCELACIFVRKREEEKRPAPHSSSYQQAILSTSPFYIQFNGFSSHNSGTSGYILVVLHKSFYTYNTLFFVHMRVYLYIPSARIFRTAKCLWCYSQIYRVIQAHWSERRLELEYEKWTDRSKCAI